MLDKIIDSISVIVNNEGSLANSTKMTLEYDLNSSDYFMCVKYFAPEYSGTKDKEVIVDFSNEYINLFLKLNLK